MIVPDMLKNAPFFRVQEAPKGMGRGRAVALKRGALCVSLCVLLCAAKAARGARGGPAAGGPTGGRGARRF